MGSVTGMLLARGMEQDTWSTLCRLAESQCGLFSAAQAARIGISHADLFRAARQGHLRRARSGIYAVCGAPQSRWEDLVAAALAVGPDAVISHTGAATLHRLNVVGPTRLPELTVPMHHHPRLAGVTLHRRGPLSRQDVRVMYGVPVTAPARTLVDLAGRYELRALERILDEALIERRLNVAELNTCLQRTAPNARGRSKIQRLLAHRFEAPLADSMLEARAFEALKALQPFEAHFVTGVGKALYVIDAAWPDKRVGAEIIGRTHRIASRSAFDRERRKLNALAAAGWRIAHLTSVMSESEMVETVRRLL
jgi:predicted transcriptional regulator of viral defense system